MQAAVADDDPVRASWAVVERLEPGALYVPIEARDDRAGAPAIDPKLLLALWIHATSEGETSARAIARLTEVHASYAWLCGGVHVGYRTVSDLRADRGDVFDALLSTDDARQRYELRAATAETVNADARTHRGLDHLPLRGLAKALTCATSFALTYAVLRLSALRG